MSITFVYVKMLNFYLMKCTVNTVVRQTTDWEKLFATYIIDNGCIFGVYKVLLQINKKYISKSPPKK